MLHARLDQFLQLVKFLKQRTAVQRHSRRKEIMPPTEFLNILRQSLKPNLHSKYCIRRARSSAGFEEVEAVVQVAGPWQRCDLLEVWRYAAKAILMLAWAMDRKGSCG